MFETGVKRFFSPGYVPKRKSFLEALATKTLS